jgi:CBS domain-containing protein
MNRQSLRREAIAILVSIFFLALGFIAVWISKEFLKQEGDTLFVALLFVPIIVYVIFSGRLKELRAGGLEAKFIDIAEQSVEVASETIEPSTEEMEIVAKGDIKELQRRLQRLDESKPIILTLALGKIGYYDRQAGLQYIEALSQYRNFKFVVILDSENKFVAYIPSWAMLQILRLEGLGSEFVRIISEGNKGDLRRYPGIVTKTISIKATNLDALREMTAQNLDALVVIDENQKLKGVVEREQILSKLLLGMARY